MKAIKLFAILTSALLCNFGLQSQNYIAVQHGSTLTQYTTLDAAITGAQDGDNVYIPGGSFNLSVDIFKKLFIYGAGYYPGMTSVTNETIIQNSLTVTSGADGGLLTGVHITGTMKFGTAVSNQIVNDYSVRRCKIDGALALSFDGSTTTSSNNFYISENIILGSINGGNSQNPLIEKNILQSYISDFMNGGIFRNNICLYDRYSTYCSQWMLNLQGFFGYSQPQKIVNCLFENNIFFTSLPLKRENQCGSDSYSEYCILNNNLFITNISFPYQTNLGSNNIIGQSQNTIFENQTGNTFSYSHDYHLKSTCPGKNAGTDGNDVGIYGTLQPYKDGALPANPHISQKIISTENNQINVNITVTAQDR